MQCSLVKYSVMQYSLVKYILIQYSLEKYSVMQYSVVKYGAMQYSSVQCRDDLHNIAIFYRFDRSARITILEILEIYEIYWIIWRREEQKKHLQDQYCFKYLIYYMDFVLIFEKFRSDLWNV